MNDFRAPFLAMLGSVLAVWACSDPPPAPVVSETPANADLTLQIVPGETDERLDTVLATPANPFRVLVMRKGNFVRNAVAVQGVQVTWRIRGFPEGSFLSKAEMATDTSGVASATVTFGSVSTGFTVEASVPGASGSPVRFRAHAFPGAPTGLVFGGGNHQIGLVNTALPGEYTARTTDSYGNAVGGVIDWQVATGGGSLKEPACDPDYEFCPHSGWIHVLGPADGSQTVTATASLLPRRPQVTFTATAVTAIVRDGECGYWFDPPDVTVSVGKTVQWLWCWYPDLSHNVTFEDGKGSSPTQDGGSHIRNFTVAGTYRYRCTLHSTSFTQGEVGAVVVKSP